jgi:hypothetical protein
VTFRHSVAGEARDQLIVKLYTGGYSQEIRHVDKRALASGIWKRAFGREHDDNAAPLPVAERAKGKRDLKF